MPLPVAVEKLQLLVWCECTTWRSFPNLQSPLTLIGRLPESHNIIVLTEELNERFNHSSLASSVNSFQNEKETWMLIMSCAIHR
jgi:hypothetical protein